MSLRLPFRVAAFLVLGLSSSIRAQPPAPAGPPEAVAAVEIKPHPCRVPLVDGEVLCATYPVWENRDTKQGRKIGLNIVILPALGPDKQPDPVFELAGGPGQGSASIAGIYAGSKLRRKRDIVLVDQRGSGRSNPLRCTLYGDPLDLRLAARDEFPVDGARECRKQLEKVADLTQYTTTAFVDDLNEVRQWLGYGRINLKGGSYGTRAAQVYWRRHPETVRSVAERAAKFMTNRLHVVIPRGSHGGAGDCTENLIRDFVDRASTKGLDPSCAATAYGPTQFMLAPPAPAP